MASWLLKTEPEEYSYDDLEKDGRTRWDGVSNPVAQRNLRAMREGDRVLVLGGEGWRDGVKGIVASKMVARYGVPVFLFSTPHCTGTTCSLRESEQGIWVHRIQQFAWFRHLDNMIRLTSVDNILSARNRLARSRPRSRRRRSPG